MFFHALYNPILFNNLQSKQSTKRKCSIDTHQYKNVSDTKKNHGNNLSNTVGEEMRKEIKQSNNISNEVNKKNINKNVFARGYSTENINGKFKWSKIL